LDRVVVEAPATSANLGPGFDVFALALKKPVDRVELSVAGSGPPKVTLEVSDDAGIPSEPRKNAAGAVALSMARKLRLEGNLKVRVIKGVPVGVGLGSSGASSAAAAVAVDRLFALGMGVPELIQHAGEGERAAAGTTHLDNVTAAIMGGFVIVPRGEGAPVRFDPARSLKVGVVTPVLELPARKTEYARSLLPRTVPLSSMVENVWHASKVVAGFSTGDIAMIGEGMQDAVVEPARARMVPGFEEAKDAARKAGAAGACLSGAGPSILSIVDGRRADPEKVFRAVVKSFEKRGVGATGFVTTVGEGARVVEGH
jgi:homoserine kinase